LNPNESEQKVLEKKELTDADDKEIALEFARIPKEAERRMKMSQECKVSLYAIMDNIIPNQLKKVIRMPILGMKEGKISLEELLLCSEMENAESNLLIRRLVPSPANPDILVEKVELDF